MATLTKGKTFSNGEIVTPQKLHELVDLGTVSGIVNADISGSAAIADTKLAQITTANKVANSATSATSANTTNAIVTRDGSGNFSAGTISAALSGNATTATTAASCSGNAATATTLQTARTINGASFNGSANITVTADPNAHTHGNITNAGAIGTTASLPIITGTSGVLQAGSFGTTAGTFCQGNDSRLSDARTPAAHTHDDRYYTETEVNTLFQKINGQTISAGLNWSGNTGIQFSGIPTGVQKFTLLIEIWIHNYSSLPGRGVVNIGTTTSGLITWNSSGVIANPYYSAVNNLENYQGFEITGGANTAAEHVGVFNFYVTNNPFSPSTQKRLIRESHVTQRNTSTGEITILQGTGFIDYTGEINEFVLRPAYGSNAVASAAARLYYYY